MLNRSISAIRSWRIKQQALCFNIILFSLLQWGCSSSQEPPLHEAALRGDLKTVQQLIQQGVPVDSKNSEGATALHWAAFKGHADVARYLLNYGADVNAKTTKGSTPLRLATTHKQQELITLLKARGAIMANP